MNFRGQGLRARLFNWAKNKMTGDEAFAIFYGEKGEDYPREMKDEFAQLFEEMKQAHEKLNNDRKTFMDKWKEYAPEQCGNPQGDRFSHGGPCGEAEHFRGHGRGFHGWGW